jgi:N-carbamoyl-L-amino-acid hydrolase
MTEAGVRVSDIGRDQEMLDVVETFLELHVEQGRGLVYQGKAVGVATSIWPHGRFRANCVGEANHAGTTRMRDRSDALVRAAQVIVEVQRVAEDLDVLATVGRLDIEPNGVNAIAGSVGVHLDLRAPRNEQFDGALSEISRRTGVSFEVVSLTPATTFDPELSHRIARDLDLPLLGTGAGHDAGIVSDAGVPTAMLFVRNESGVSHSPSETATVSDCEAGVVALAETLMILTRPAEPNLDGGP